MTKKIVHCSESNNSSFHVVQVNGAQYELNTLAFQTDRVTWYRPTSLADMLLLKEKHPDARIVIGNTEIGELDD